MRRIRNASGQFRFEPKQWLTANQIKNYFSSLSAKLKKKQDIETSKKQKSKVSLEDIQLSDEELEDEIALDEAKENEMYKNKVLNSLEKSVDSLSECPLKVKGKIFINYVSFYFLFSDQQYRCVRSCNAIFKCKKNA